MAVQAGEVAQAELQVEGGEQAAADHHLTAKAIANGRRVALEAKLGFQLKDLGNSNTMVYNFYCFNYLHDCCHCLPITTTSQNTPTCRLWKLFAL